MERDTPRLCTWSNVYRLLDYDATKDALERVANKNFRLLPDTIGVDVDPNY